VGADAIDDAGHEPRAVFERATVATRTVARAQEFVAEVSVAVLHVDEGEPGACGQSRRRDEFLDQPIELIV
jgi:hypothetical protein